MMGPWGHVPGVECGRQRGRLESKDHPYPHLGDQPQREVRPSSYLKAIRKEGKKKNACYLSDCKSQCGASQETKPTLCPSPVIQLWHLSSERCVLGEQESCGPAATVTGTLSLAQFCSSPCTKCLSLTNSWILHISWMCWVLLLLIFYEWGH